MSIPKMLGLQERFLDSLLIEKTPVAVYLINGVKLEGIIEAYDHFVVLLKNSLSQIIYKHNICSILPVTEIKRFPSSSSSTEETLLTNAAKA